MTPDELAARARQRQGSGDLDGAMSDVTEALRQDPRHAEAFHVRAHIRRDRGQFWRSIWDFKRSARRAPQDYRNFYCRAVARRLRRDWKGALSDLETALRMCPSSALALCYRGLMRLELGRLDQAIADYDQA